jgi:hypothetical protein
MGNRRGKQSRRAKRVKREISGGDASVTSTIADLTTKLNALKADAGDEPSDAMRKQIKADQNAIDDLKSSEAASLAAERALKKQQADAQSSLAAAENRRVDTEVMESNKNSNRALAGAVGRGFNKILTGIYLAIVAAWTFGTTIVGWIGAFFSSKGGPAGEFIKVAMPYIVLFLIFFGVVIMFSLPSFGVPVGNIPKFNTPSAPVTGGSWFAMSAMPKVPHALKVTVSQVLYPSAAGNIDGVARPVQAEGRCDEVYWHHVGEGTSGSVCAKTTSPKPIVWNISASSIPELNLMTPGLQKHITKDGKKLQVTIPYTFVNNKHVPDCTLARFGDGTDASYLFTNNDDTSCTLATHDKKAF